MGGASGAHAVAVDAGGNVYVTGYQRCALATALGCLQYQTFVRKMSPTLQQDGDAYSTFLGDADCCQTSGQSIAVDMAGHTYVTGVTDDAGLPAAGTPFQPALGGGDDAFLVEVSPTGGLLYSTYLGGSANDSGAGIAVDAVGNAYLTGETASADFPTAGSPFQPANAGGRDGFVAKLSSTAGLLYSTYLGGSADDSGRGIAVDAAGNAHLTGQTASGGFPTAGSPFQPALAGQSDAFVAKLSPTSGLIESTYLGGSAVDDGRGIAIDAAANIYVTGSTSSANFYTAGSPVQAVSAGSGDAFVVGIRGNGTAFFTVTPCRVADTRSPAGSSGGPALGAHTTRSFPVAGLCGVPPTAVAVAINVTVVDATDYGDLRLFPAGATAPAASTINFGAYTVRANNAVIALGTGGQVSVRCDMPPGSTGQTDFLFDVTGYFE